MNDVVTPDAVPALSAGQRLRQAREAAGLHVVALAAMLKVPVRKLEALEADRYDELPDKTFVRALALSVCRQLKVSDSGTILALLPQTEQVRLGENPTLGTPFKSPDVTLAQKSAGVSLPRPVLFAGGVLLLAAVVWFAVPERDPAAVKVTPVALPNGAAPAAETPPPPQLVAAGNEPSVTTAPAEPADVAPAAATVVATPPPTPASTPATVPVSSAPAVPTALAATGNVMQIRASAVTWVEVVGASGNLLMQRELNAGEHVDFSADAPYKVVVGRADATQVSVRGKALDIAAFARNNVARFEVK